MVLQWANLGYLTISLNRRGTLVLTKTMEMGSERCAMERRLFGRIFGNKLRVAVVPGRFRHAGEQFAAAVRRVLAREIFDKKGGSLFLLQAPCQLLLAVAIGYLAGQMLPEGGGFAVLAVLIGMVSLLYGLYVHKALTALFARRGMTPIYLGLLVPLPLILVLGLLFGALLETLVGVTACVFSGAVSARGPRRNQRDWTPWPRPGAAGPSTGRPPGSGSRFSMARTAGSSSSSFPVRWRWGWTGSFPSGLSPASRARCPSGAYLRQRGNVCRGTPAAAGAHFEAAAQCILLITGTNWRIFQNNAGKMSEFDGIPAFFPCFCFTGAIWCGILSEAFGSYVNSF